MRGNEVNSRKYKIKWWCQARNKRQCRWKMAKQNDSKQTHCKTLERKNPKQMEHVPNWKKLDGLKHELIIAEIKRNKSRHLKELWQESGGTSKGSKRIVRNEGIWKTKYYETKALPRICQVSARKATWSEMNSAGMHVPNWNTWNSWYGPSVRELGGWQVCSWKTFVPSDKP